MCVTFVSEPWVCEFDANGVTITYRSGDQTYTRRMSRPDYRVGLEVSLRQLNEFEDHMRTAEVVRFEGGQRKH